MKKSIKKPTRLITFGNYEWTHWLIVSLFFVLGIVSCILPSLIAKKLIIGSIIIGLLCIVFFIYCVIEQIRYIKKMKIWKEINTKENNKNKEK